MLDIPFLPSVEKAEAAILPAIKVESFDQDVATDGSTFTLNNDVGATSSAFIKINTGTRKSSAGPTASTGNTGPNVGTAGLVLTDTTTVTVERVNATAVKVMGEVWRYEGDAGGSHEFVVRDRVAISLTGASQTTAISGISNVDNVVPFVTGYTVNDGSNANWEYAAIAAHMDDSGNLVVSRNNSGTAATVYVDVVEFTGSAWTVCHGYSNAHDGIEETVTLNTDSDGQGGSACDVTDWGTATIIEATMEGDSSETGISDTMALVRPGANTTSVVFDLLQDAAAQNDGEAWIHVLQNDDLAVHRNSNGDIAEGDGTYGTATWPSGASTAASLDTLSLEWFVDSSGVGNANMRGGLHARITDPTGIISHWVHRSGNAVGVEYGVVELAGLTFLDTTTEVSATGTQIATVDSPVTNQALGGTFVIQEITSSRYVTGITITESGTVDAANDLTNIELWYDLSTTATYDCSEHSFDGNETQFGATDINGFTSADGVSAFSGSSVLISTTQSMCVYVVYDSTGSEDDGDTVDISILDPTTDVAVTDSGSVGPVTSISPTGVSTFQNADLTQIHYHWRTDDGTETSITGGIEDTFAGGFQAGTNRRLRVEVSAEGSADASPAQFRLQYGEKITTCEAITTWKNTAEVGGEWEVIASSNVTDGADTTDIANGIGGVTNEESSIVSPNGAQMNANDKSPDISINNDEFVELEYTVAPTALASDGSTYCFRVIDQSPDVTHPYRLPIVIQSSQVDSALTDFPVYVDLSDLGVHFFSNVQADGGDIRITASDGSTELAREIASIDTGGATGELYFKADSLSSSTDTTFYLYYGNADMEDYQANSVYGAESVWSNGFEVVYHFEGDPSGSAPQYVDSTGNSAGTSVNMEGVDQVSGQAGNGAQIDGVDEHIETDADLGSILDTTWSIFLNANGVQEACDGIIFSRGTDISGINYGGCQDVAELGYHWNDGAGTYGFADGPILPTDEWAMAAMVITSTDATLYALTDSGVTSGTNVAAHAASTIDNLDFGWDSFGDARSFSGIMDEVRLSSVARNQDWLEAEYRNLNAPAAFYATSTYDSNTADPILITYDVYAEANITADAFVTAIGTQSSNVNEASTNNYLGGAFVVKENTGSRDVESITLTELGTVDASSSLTNVELYYEFDTSGADGYDCSSESYGGSELQYGSTAVSGFSSTNGTSTFTDTGIGITTTQSLCLYVIYDVTASANDGETIDIEISLPNSQVLVSSGSVGPGTPAQITSSTTISAALLTQTHYHWRNDDGDETDSGATSATSGNEDTALGDVPRNANRRLRLQVSNEGPISSQATTYRLEYGTKIETCETVTIWQQVGVGSAFVMATSTHISDGNTTDIDNIANGAMTEENTTFVGTGALREDSSDSGSIALSNTEYTELEYSIRATDASAYGTDYCFRVTDAGSSIEAYSVYAELTTREKQDFYVQRGSEYVSGTGQTFVAGVDYIAPSATSSAFVRITNSMMTGAGDDVGSNSQNTDDVTAYISDQSDLTTSFTISRPSTAISNTRVDWEIVEFVGLEGTDNEMIVRDTGVVPFAATELTNSGGTVSGVVDDGDVVVFVTGQRNRGSGTNKQYNDGLFTAEWNATTSQPDFERGDEDNAADVSYAVVEFTGANWKIQRIEHQYSASGVTESETMEAVTAPTQAFVHAQKRVGQDLTSIDEQGHEVWISSMALVSFELRNTAETPSGHISVAWVIENTQTGDGALVSYRSDGDIPGTTADPVSYIIPVGGTVRPSNSSIFPTNTSAGTGTTYPRIHAAFTIASSTDYELWQSDNNNDHSYRVEVIEWPVAELSARQYSYRFYADNDQLTPTDPWPPGPAQLGDNTSITATDEPLGEGEVVRIRMSLLINNASMPENISSFKLQFGRRITSCSAIESNSTWVDLGDPGSGALWRGYDGAIADGTALATSTPASGTLLVTESTVAGTYEESNNTQVNPYAVDIGEIIEYDWAVEHNGALQRTDYCFRMVNSDGSDLTGYNNYPTLRTTGYTPVVGSWRWYADETNETPNSPLAAENVAPSEIANEDVIKLRVLSTELENAAGSNVKFGLQYSQYPDFSDGGTFLTSYSACTPTSTWCYADGAGIDNAVIATSTLSEADSCVAGVGNGCGTHNEIATTTSTLTQSASSNMEFEFTIQSAAPRVNGVYYFRLYDMTNDDGLNASSSYPSLVTEGAQLVFSLSGVSSGTIIDGETLDITSTTTTIPFGTIPFDTEYVAGYRLNVDTNATEGYLVLMYSDQQLLNAYGTQIDPVAGDNTTPTAWNAGCLANAVGCFGYHVEDDILSNGSTRFALDDSYAALSTTPQEVMYSSVPTEDTHDIVYKLQISEEQPAGQYETSVTFISIPIF